MSVKSSGWLLSGVLVLGLLLPAPAGAWGWFGCGNAPLSDGVVPYSPCHYNCPMLYRLKAWCFGLPGIPVYVYPQPIPTTGWDNPAADTTSTSASSEKTTTPATSTVAPTGTADGR
jgi:hypothetical protein